MRNTLYYGDNLQVLRDHVLDESVDLVRRYCFLITNNRFCTSLEHNNGR